MAIKQFSLPCAKCDEVMPHNQDVPNHVAHGLATLFTGGYWGVVWGAKAVKKRDLVMCTKCGNLRNVNGPATIWVPPAAAPAGEFKPMSKEGQIFMWGTIIVVLAIAVMIGVTSE